MFEMEVPEIEDGVIEINQYPATRRKGKNHSTVS
ncbi:MAG: hypothetical protein CM1200mP33_4450 [Chloroflexota bacterium]|nr:MAG: hypothetical protein CM1200mP33_4450 [Chloroflexota bacterium]